MYLKLYVPLNNNFLSISDVKEIATKFTDMQDLFPN